MASGYAVYDDGVLRITRTGSPHVLALAGEIDESNYRGLVDTLRKIADELSEIHFDLAGVQYCDLAGLRAIVQLAGAGTDGSPGGHGGRRVVLHAVPRRLKAVPGILGWDSTAGLAVEEPASGTAPRPAGLVAGGLIEARPTVGG
jgi:ABC-type transporter Mla MlaB component